MSENYGKSTDTEHGVNLYVKNLDDTIDDERLPQEFLSFGAITSAKVMINNEGRSKGYGFVCFISPNDAMCAVNEMNGRVVGSSKPLYVALAQRKAERKAELKAVAAANMQMQACGVSQAPPQVQPMNQKKLVALANNDGKSNCYETEHGVNLYVKNLDDTIDDERLHQLFLPFGAITSSKVMVDEQGRSKGFGFVYFVSPLDALNAIDELNRRFVGSKFLYVTPMLSKAERKAQLASQYMRHMSGMSMQRFEAEVANMQACGGGGVSHHPPNYKYTANMWNSPLQQVQAPPPVQPMFQKSQIKLLASLLAHAEPHEQKQILRQQVYPKVECMHSQFAREITEMLLEIEISEVLEMLEDDDVLKAKVEEAAAILEDV